MLSDNALNPLADVEAKIQSRIAKFLTMKEILLNFMNNPSISISSKAKELYTTQDILEGQLTKTLETLKTLQQGSWTFSDVTGAGLFYASMEKQIRDVGDLQSKAGKTVYSGSGFVDWLPYLVGAGVVVGGLLIMRKK